MLKPNEKDILMFRGLATSRMGKQFMDYMERFKTHLFSPEVLTKENFDGMKKAVEEIEDQIIKRIRLVNDSEGATKNEYE